MTEDRSRESSVSDHGYGPTGPRMGPGVAYPDERKLVTVLFADLAGFTAFAETLDPEPVRDLLNGLFDILAPCVEGNRGSVDKFLGDSLMAIFGAPVTHADDAERAVRAALEMREALAVFNQERGTAFSIHVGINSGRVIAGTIGGGARLEYTVIGDAVNVAKRLEEASAPGEILLGSATRQLVGSGFEVEETGVVPGGGRAGPVAAYRVLGEVVPSAGRLREGAELTAFVGRGEEFKVVGAALERLEMGQGGALFVFGGAGVGKSRLMLEARRRFGGRAVAWLEGRGGASRRSLSYSPFVQMILTDAGVLPSDDLEQRIAKVGACIGRLFGARTGEALPTAHAFLGLRPVGSLSESVAGSGGRGRKPEILGFLRRYLAESSRERPVAVVVDDVQLLDASSAEAIEHLLTADDLQRVLFCLLGRAADGPIEARLLGAARVSVGAAVTTVVLDPLSPGETEGLIQNMLDRGRLPVGLGHTVHRRALGNPLFAEEIVRHLIDVGVLVREGGQGPWTLGASAPGAVVPDSLQGVIAARIDSLPDGEKRCLSNAAVIGRSFDRRVLAAMDMDVADLDGRLAELTRRSLVAIRPISERGTFVFAHALVHEAAYESLLRKNRRELHGRAARAIESVFPGRLEEQAGILAFHYSRAEEWESARHYLVLAGDRSAGIAGDAEAIALYREAMAAMLRAFDEEWNAPDGGDAVSWFVTRIEPFYEARQLGELIDAVEHFYNRVRASCGPGDPRTVAAASVLGASYLHKGMDANAQRLLESTLRERDPARKADLRSVVRILITLGLVHIGAGSLSEAEHNLEAALALEKADPKPDPRLLGECFLFLSSVRYYTGRHGPCRELVEEALRSPVVREGPRYLELMLHMSNCLLFAGELDEAAVWARTCAERATSSYLRARAGLYLGMVDHARAEFAEAERRFEAVLSVFEDLGRAYETAEAAQFLAEAQLQAGRVGAARETATRALRLIESIEGPQGWHVPKAHWTLAGVALAEGRLEEAERLLTEGEAIAKGRVAKTDPLWSELLFRRALVRSRLGRVAEADGDYQQADSFLRESWGDGHPRRHSMRAEWMTAPVGDP
ncbi:MAG: ATP-binding protein [Thermoleophilia bacterium]